MSICQGVLIMDRETEQEWQAFIEESWYWSVIDDIVKIFDLYGKDKVMDDVANMKLSQLENHEKGIE